MLPGLPSYPDLESDVLVTVFVPVYIQVIFTVKISFSELAPVPYFERQSVQRKKVFTSYWMTSDTNFATVKRIEKETAKKEKKKEKERVSNEALAKIKKEQAIKKQKIQRKVVKKIKSNPKL